MIFKKQQSPVIKTVAWLGMAVAISVATGCSSSYKTVSGQPANLNSGKISVAPKAYQIKLNVNGQQLALSQKTQLVNFLSRHGPIANQRILVTGSSSLQPDVTRLMRKLGVAAEHWRWQLTDEKNSQLAVITEYFVAKTPDCPDWRKPELLMSANQSWSNFGCANATNLALMVANPRHLLKGNKLAPASSARVVTGLRLYQQYGASLTADSLGGSASSTDQQSETTQIIAQ